MARSQTFGTVAAVGFAAIVVFAVGLQLGDEWRHPANVGEVGALWQRAGQAVELLIACWVLLGPTRRVPVAAAIGLLVLFIGVNLWHLVTGAGDCGCFGAVKVGPAITAGLDASLLLTLIASWPRSKPCQGSGSPVRPGLLFVGAAVLFASALFMPINTSTPTHIERVVFLDPQLAIGRRFPLAAYLPGEASALLLRGSQTVILYSHDCDRCRRVMATLRATSSRANHRWEIDLAAALPAAGARSPREPRLDGRSEYVARVPVRLTLADGVVVRVEPL